jgi:hypothetical protein
MEIRLSINLESTTTAVYENIKTAASSPKKLKKSCVFFSTILLSLQPKKFN